MTDDAALRRLFEAIASDSDGAALQLLQATPGLADAALAEGATRQAAAENFLGGVGHHVYAGDTALHVAAAAYRPLILRRLIEAGAKVAAANRRGAQALHYAADGDPSSARWNPTAQAETISALIAAGADPNARDKNGVTPLHRAVRTRSAAAVAALLEGGADMTAKNGSGSTPLALALTTTGRGGSGSPEAKAQQAQIVTLLQASGA